MPMLTYEVTCPICQETVVKKRSASAPAPIYCGTRCQRLSCTSAYTHLHGTWRKYQFDDLMNQAIVRACRHGYGALKRLWQDDPRFERAGIPYPIVKRQVHLLGIVRTQPDGRWQDDELAFALARWEQGSPPDSISRDMRQHGWHRSPGAIVTQAQLRHLPPNGACLSLHQVAIGFGVDSHVPKRWVQKGWLRVHHTSATGEVQFVHPTALKRFITQHPWAVAKGHPDLVWLIGLLTTPGTGLEGRPTMADTR